MISVVGNLLEQANREALAEAELEKAGVKRREVLRKAPANVNANANEAEGDARTGGEPEIDFSAFNDVMSDEDFMPDIAAYEAFMVDEEEGERSIFDVLENKETEHVKVKKGDSVWKLAMEGGVSVEDVLNANPQLKDRVTYDENGKVIDVLIKEGEKLVVPVAAGYKSQGASSSKEQKQTANDNTKKAANDNKGEFCSIPNNKLEEFLKNYNLIEEICKPNKPTIELVVRDVIAGLKHGFTIFTDSLGRKTIITGFPEKNDFIGACTTNLKTFDVAYIEENKDLLGKIRPEGGDYRDDEKYRIITTIELNNDMELQHYMTKAREGLRDIETSVNGGRPDYVFVLHTIAMVVIVILYNVYYGIQWALK